MNKTFITVVTREANNVSYSVWKSNFPCKIKSLDGCYIRMLKRLNIKCDTYVTKGLPLEPS